jgi:hypothetical protein
VTHNQIKAGAEDAARHLGYRIVGSGMHDASGEGATYSFRFATGGEDADIAFLVLDSVVRRAGLTPREYARLEILNAFRDAKE